MLLLTFCSKLFRIFTLDIGHPLMAMFYVTKLNNLCTCIFHFQLNSRVRKQIEEKRRLVTSLAAGVSPEGQKLFLAISRT